MSWWWRSLDCVDFFLWGVVHHPVTRSSAHGLFIFRRCMVRHLQFLLSLASQTLSQVDYLRAGHVCCASDSLRIPGTLACLILGVICSPFCRLPLPRGFVVEGFLCLAPSGHLHHWRAWRPLSLHFASSSALAWRFLGYPFPLGECSSPVELHGVLDRSVPAALIWTWCFCHPIRHTVVPLRRACLARLWYPLF